MNISEFSILCGGILTVAMVIFHTRFYVMFGWKSEFEKVQLKNHYIFYTIHLALILLFVIFGIVSLVYFKELAACTGLAFGLDLLYALFWLWRAIWQIVYFKGKTTIHYLIILITTLLFIFYILPVIMKV